MGKAKDPGDTKVEGRGLVIREGGETKQISFGIAKMKFNSLYYNTK